MQWISRESRIVGASYYVPISMGPDVLDTPDTHDSPDILDTSGHIARKERV